MKFSEKLKKYRDITHTTQEELASQLGVAFQTVNRLEGDNNSPSKKVEESFKALCEKNNIDIEEKKEIGINFISSQKLKIIFYENKRKTEQQLPALVERMINESSNCSIKEMRFPKNDAIVTSGIDGYLEAESDNVFIPNGISFWELGTTAKKSKSKIKQDLEKRTREYPLKKRKNASIICVTTGTLPKKVIEDIRDEYKAEGWKEVKIYDLIEIETWLRFCPGSSAWLLEQYFSKPIRIESFNKASKELFELTIPKSTPSLYIEDREESTKKIVELINSKQKVIKIMGPSKKETYGFVMSSLYKENNQTIISKTIVCNDFETLKNIDLTIEDSIIIINFELPAEYRYGNNTHIVILDRKDYQNQQIDIRLYERSKSTIYKILEKDMKIPFPQLNQIKIKAENNLLLVLKNILNDDVDMNTKWSSDSKLNKLIPILLLGKYDRKNSVDNEILNYYSVKNVEIYYNELLEWKKVDGSPLIFYDDIIKVNSKSELWSLLYEHIDKAKIDKVKNRLVAIFNESNDKYDLKPDERYMAQLYGKNWKYSKYQIENMFDCITLYSIYNKDQNYADHFIKELLSNIKDNKAMFSVSEYFKNIVECSPIEFIKYVEKEIKDKNSKIFVLFEDKNIKDTLFSTSNCYYLFHAIERAMLFKETVTKALDILYDIDQYNFEYKYGNTPIQILISKLHWANNSTVLSLNEKEDYIEHISKRANNLDFLVKIITLDSFYEMDEVLNWKPFNKDNDCLDSIQILQYYDAIIELVVKNKNKININNVLDELFRIIRNNILIVNSQIKILNLIKDNCCSHDIKIYKKAIMLKNNININKNSKLLKELEEVIRVIEPEDELEKNIIYLTCSNYDFDLFNVNDNNPNKIIEEIKNKQIKIFENLKKKYGVEKIFKALLKNIDKKHYGLDYLYDINYSTSELNTIFGLLVSDNQFIILSRIMANNSDYSKKFIKKMSTNDFNNLLPYIAEKGYNIVSKDMLKDDKQMKIYYSSIILRDFNDKEEIKNIINYNPMEYLNAVAYRLEYERWNIDEILGVLQGVNEDQITNSHDTCCIAEILHKLDDNIQNENLLNVEIKYFDYFGYEELPKCLTNYIYKNPEEYIEIYKRLGDDKNLYKLWYKLNQTLKLPNDFYKNEEVTDHFINCLMNYYGKEDDVRYIRHNLGKILARTRTDNNLFFLPDQICDLIEHCNNEDVNDGVAIGYYNSMGVRNVTDGSDERKEAYDFIKKANEYAVKCPNVCSVFNKIANDKIQQSKMDKLHWLENKGIL